MRVGKFAIVGISGLVLVEVLLFVLTEFAGFFYVVSVFIALEIRVTEKL